MLGIVAAAVLLSTLPLFVNDYWVHIATLAATYWVLVSGLNLVVGYGGMLAVGYVGLLAVGAYTASILVDKLGALPSSSRWPPPARWPGCWSGCRRCG